MRTFWIYFFIFLCLFVLTQIFLYFSSAETYAFTPLYVLGQLLIVTLIALIVSMMLRKKKNEYKQEKAN